MKVIFSTQLMSDNNNDTNQSFLTDFDPDINCNFFTNQHSNEYDINTFNSLITTNIFYLFDTIDHTILVHRLYTDF